MWTETKSIQISKSIDQSNLTKSKVLYPSNLRVGSYIYFLAAPTLCYQTCYPQSPHKPRKLFVFKRLNEVVFSLIGMYCLAFQYALPVLEECKEALETQKYLYLLERTLKLSVVSVLMWLLMFWCMFHSWLNLMGELMQFGDRMFYKAWWNSKDISEYWRLWNAPVHNWCKRHVYRPLIACNVSPTISVITVFTVSAILHEVLIGIPTHNLQGYAFVGMMLQIPLILFTHAFNEIRSKWFGDGLDHVFDTIGNFLFWTSFTVVGQPACIVLYYYMYSKEKTSL
jgi:diacylglycerol O-acyltransferase-1